MLPGLDSTQRSKLHLDRFSRFCTPHVRESLYFTMCVQKLLYAVEESIRMTADRGKWRKYVHGVANPRIEEG